MIEQRRRITLRGYHARHTHEIDYRTARAVVSHRVPLPPIQASGVPGPSKEVYTMNTIQDVLKHATREEIENIIIKAWEAYPESYEDLNKYYSDTTHTIINLLQAIAEREYTNGQ